MKKKLNGSLSGYEFMVKLIFEKKYHEFRFILFKRFSVA